MIYFLHELEIAQDRRDIVEHLEIPLDRIVNIFHHLLVVDIRMVGNHFAEMLATQSDLGNSMGDICKLFMQKGSD